MPLLTPDHLTLDVPLDDVSIDVALDVPLDVALDVPLDVALDVPLDVALDLSFSFLSKVLHQIATVDT